MFIKKNNMEKIEFQNGVITPALKIYVDEILYKITKRFDYFILNDVKSDISFLQIIEKEKAGKYIQFNDLQSDISTFFSAAKASEDPAVLIVSQDIENKITKEFSLIHHLSECEFKTVTNECVNNLMNCLGITQFEINDERERIEHEKQQLIEIRKTRILNAMEKESPNRDIPIKMN